MEESDRFNVILLPKSLSLISIVKEGQCFAPPFLNKIHPLLCLTAKYEIVMISSLIADSHQVRDSGFAESAFQDIETVNTINQIIPSSIPLPKLPIIIPRRLIYGIRNIVIAY